MKKILISVSAFVAVVAGGAFVFKEDLKEVVFWQVTEGMFLEEDADEFEPGPDVSNRFPALRVAYAGGELASLDQFAGERGLIVMFNRSVVW